MAKAALKTASSDSPWTWMGSLNDKERWSTIRIPDGDVHAPIIKRMSKNSDGTWTFYVYRNMKCLGCTKDKISEKGLLAAQAMAKAGKMNAEAAKDNKEMLAYVDGKTRDAVLFKKLSPVSQRTIADVYPWALPSNRALDVAKVKAPKTTRTDLMGKHEKAAAKAGKYNIDATIKRVKDGNAKKPGSKQHERWETVFAFDGKTVRQCLNGGGDKYGIEGTLEAGYIKLVDPK